MIRYLLRQFLQTLIVWPVSVLCEYSSFIPVFAHIGHVPRPFEGRLLIVLPLFLFAIFHHPFPIDLVSLSNDGLA
jgi:hypothetical protein